MITSVISMGSKWGGESPDTIQDLLNMLAAHPLNPLFEDYGNFVNPSPEWINKANPPYPDESNVHVISGNFMEWSYVFNIHTNDPAVIESLTLAIRANQQRTDYQNWKVELKRRAVEYTKQQERAKGWDRFKPIEIRQVQEEAQPISPGQGACPQN